MEAVEKIKNYNGNFLLVQQQLQKQKQQNLQ